MTHFPQAGKKGGLIPHLQRGVLLPTPPLSPNTCPRTSITQLEVLAELNRETKDRENAVIQLQLKGLSSTLEDHCPTHTNGAQGAPC